MNARRSLGVLVVALTASVGISTSAQCPTTGVSGAGGSAPVAKPEAPDAAGGAWHFEPNLGQTDPRVRFLARGPGGTLFLTETEAALLVRRSGGRDEVVSLRLPGAATAPRIEGLDPLPGRSHYLRGAPRATVAGVPHFARVRYRGVYPGIDLEFHAGGGGLEYDLVVASGADPGRIRLEFAGAADVALDAGGDLVLATGAGRLRHRRPFIYQEGAGERHAVAGRYVGLGDGVFGVEVAEYDRGRALIVDPVLEWASYLGGSGDEEVRGLAVDALGQAYVTGRTRSADFPAAGGPPPGGGGGAGEAFVAKFDPAGSTLIYAAYFGGSGDESGTGIAVDPYGFAYVAGWTDSANFPVGGGAYRAVPAGATDGFIMSLDPQGGLIYSTYFGGAGHDRINAIAVDAYGRVHVTGETESADFPVTAGGDLLYGGGGDAFLSVVGFGGAPDYSTFIGGSLRDAGRALAADAGGNSHVAGLTWSGDFPTVNAQQRRRRGTDDAFVAKIDTFARTVLFATYLGGECSEAATGIAVDGAGMIYVTGSTNSRRFPRSRDAYRTEIGLVDAFVTKIDPALRDPVYSTLYGGAGEERASGIAVDASGRATITGTTTSADLPLLDSLQVSPGSPAAFVARVNAAGTALAFSTYLGEYDAEFAARGEVMSVGLDAAGAAYVTGFTSATNLTTTPGSYQVMNAGGLDLFVAKIR